MIIWKDTLLVCGCRCNKYEYPSDPDGDTESKEFLNRLLDDDYLERHV